MSYYAAADDVNYVIAFVLAEVVVLCNPASRVTLPVDVTSVVLTTAYVVPEYGIGNKISLVIINHHTRRSFISDILPRIRACNPDVKVRGFNVGIDCTAVATVLCSLLLFLVILLTVHS